MRALRRNDLEWTHPLGLDKYTRVAHDTDLTAGQYRTITTDTKLEIYPTATDAADFKEYWKASGGWQVSGSNYSLKIGGTDYTGTTPTVASDVYSLVASGVTNSTASTAEERLILMSVKREAPHLANYMRQSPASRDLSSEAQFLTS